MSGGLEEALRTEFLQRLRRTWADGPPPGDLRELGDRAARTIDCAAVAVVREPHIGSFARSALRFAWGLDPVIGKRWLQGYSRTIFVLGNPGNLAQRFRFTHESDDGSISWFGPGRRSEAEALVRLLKPVPATGPAPALGRVDVWRTDSALAARTHTLYAAVEGLAWADYFIHLNHTLAEAALSGSLQPSDALRIENVPVLAALPARSTYVRVHFDRDDRARLRLYTALVPD